MRKTPVSGFPRALLSFSHVRERRALGSRLADPRGLEAVLANRLISLDKGEGVVLPIGVGEVLRRIMGKVCHEGHQTEC